MHSHQASVSSTGVFPGIYTQRPRIPTCCSLLLHYGSFQGSPPFPWDGLVNIDPCLGRPLDSLSFTGILPGFLQVSAQPLHFLRSLRKLLRSHLLPNIHTYVHVHTHTHTCPHMSTHASQLFSSMGSPQVLRSGQDHLFVFHTPWHVLNT